VHVSALFNVFAYYSEVSTENENPLSFQYREVMTRFLRVSYARLEFIMLYLIESTE